MLLHTTVSPILNSMVHFFKERAVLAALCELIGFVTVQVRVDIHVLVLIFVGLLSTHFAESPARRIKQKNLSAYIAFNRSH